MKGFSALTWKWNMMQLSFKEKVKLKECHEQTGELAGAEEAFLGKNYFPKIQVGANSSLSEREDDSHWQHRRKWEKQHFTFAFNFNLLFFNFSSDKQSSSLPTQLLCSSKKCITTCQAFSTSRSCFFYVLVFNWIRLMLV